jgi:hypothetical protein
MTRAKIMFRYLIRLIIINLVFAGLAFLAYSLGGLDLMVKDIFILCILFSTASVGTFAIFIRGHGRQPESQGMHTLVSISLKFLLDLIVALVWFFILKKTSLSSVVLFFVIYLTLSLFSIIIILKMLKTRSL